MLEKRFHSVMVSLYSILVIWYCYMLYLYKIYNEGEITYMTQQILDFSTVAAAIVALAGVVTTVISQILFYRKDSQTMSEIKQMLEHGNESLSGRMETNQKEVTGEHRDIRDIVRDIHLKQEQELEIQKKIQDTIPDAGMIKDGIDRICAENVELKNEVNGLKMEVVKLQERNKELSKTNRKLLNEIERSQEWDDRGR